MNGDDIFTVNVLDVNNVMPFAKPEGEDLQDEARAMDEVLARTSNFTTTLEKKLKMKLVAAGIDKQGDAHVLRYFFNGHEGLLELTVDRPAILAAYFLRRKDAVRFRDALKRTLRDVLPESSVKGMVIDNIEVGRGVGESITHEKHSRMRAIYLHKTFSLAIVAVFIVAVFEIVKAAAGLIAVEVFNAERLVWPVTIVAAVIISFFFDPVRKRVEHLVEKYF